ncbi:hypothetical protein [Anaerolentibacter hominis]|uniref:hypothetical protein n=1 Tax=Anaerolentibacter hominis TaxID=3079009 RepID=UPI0031B82ACC
MDDKQRNDGLIKAPHYLKENILREARRTPILTPRDRRRQMILYSLKVGSIVAAAVFMLLLTPGDFSGMKEPPVGPKDTITEVIDGEAAFSLTKSLNQATNKFCAQMYQFSNQLLNMEVFHHE